MSAALPRSLLMSLAILALLTLGIAWLVPPLLDWNRYRGEIATFVSAQLGEDLSITGQVRLSLLPEPQLAVGDVALTDRADGVSLRARELRLRVALWPLLAGRVDAREMVVRGLDLRLPWPLGRLGAALHPPSWLASIAARVEDGEVEIGGIRAHHVNATLGLSPDAAATDTPPGNTTALSGGYRPNSLTLNGTAEIGSLPWDLKLRSTAQGNRDTDTDVVAIDIALSGQGAAEPPPPLQSPAATGATQGAVPGGAVGADGIGAMFHGELAEGRLRGKLNMHGPDLSALLQAAKLPFHVDGDLTLSDNEATMDRLAIDLAGIPTRGGLVLHFDHGMSLDLALAASRVDLDAWLPALLRQGTAPLLPVAHANLDLAAESGQLAGAQLRTLHALATLDGGAIAISDLGATLPGDAQLHLAGQLKRGPDLQFDGTASLNAPSLRTTLDWLGKAGTLDSSAWPGAMFTHADLRAALHAEGGTAPLLALSDLNGVIDDSHLQGSAEFRPAMTAQKRPALKARLDLDRLTLDPFMPASFKDLTQGAGRLDLDLRLHVQAAAIGARVASPLILDFGLDAAHASVRRLDASLDGAHLVLSGSVASDGRISDGKLDMSAKASAVAGLLADLPPEAQGVASHLPHDDVTLQATASGPPDALALRTLLDLGDLHAEIQPLLNLAAAQWSGKLAFRHPGASRLAASLGLGEPRDWLGEGSFSLSGNFAGMGPPWAPTRIASDGFDLTAGQLRGNAALVWDAASGTPQLTGHINFETLPVLVPKLRSAEPLDMAQLAGWQASVKLQAGHVLSGLSPLLDSAAASLSLQNGVLRLEGLSCAVAGGKLTGSLLLDSTTTPPNLSADLSLANAALDGPVFGLPIDMAGGVLDGAAKLTASGFAPATLLATLAGQVQARLHDTVLVGVDLTRITPALNDADLHAALDGGRTAFDRMDAQASVQNGSVSFSNTDMDGPAGHVALTGSVDLVGRSEALHLALSPSIPDPPSLGLRLFGDVAAPSRTSELADALRWRAEHQPPAAHPASPPAPQHPVP